MLLLRSPHNLRFLQEVLSQAASAGSCFQLPSLVPSSHPMLHREPRHFFLGFRFQSGQPGVLKLGAAASNLQVPKFFIRSKANISMLQRNLNWKLFRSKPMLLSSAWVACWLDVILMVWVEEDQGWNPHPLISSDLIFRVLQTISKTIQNPCIRLMQNHLTSLASSSMQRNLSEQLGPGRMVQRSKSLAPASGVCFHSILFLCHHGFYRKPQDMLSSYTPVFRGLCKGRKILKGTIPF